MTPDKEMENTSFKLPPGYVHFSLNTVNVLHLMEVCMMSINLEKLA